MNQRLDFRVFLAALILVALPAAGQEIKQEMTARAAEASRAKGGLQILAPAACATMTIACGETKTSVLTSDDCSLSDGSFVDFWEFQGTAGRTVTINMSS